MTDDLPVQNKVLHSKK